MKILKKHGKKVSVMLLAIALMISPMLPIVKAADNNTCEKRFHYYFLLAEPAYIDHTTNNKNGEKTKIYRSYTSQYENYFGIVKNRDLENVPTGAEYVWRSQTPFTKADGKTQEVEMSQNLSAVSSGYSATFYNYELPSDYKLVSTSPEISYWSIDDWSRYAAMYEKLYKVSSENPTSIDQDDSYVENNNDIYFIHYGWKIGEDNKDGVYQSSSTWYNSDDTHALGTLWANFGEWKDNLANSTKKSILQKLEKSSFDIVKNNKCSAGINQAASGCTSATAINPELLGKDSSSDIEFKILREFKGIDPSQIELYGWADKVSTSSSDNTVVEDNKYWFFFPMTATYTFTASGDVCGTGNNVIDTSESSTNNPGTGIVSYAIIGTLLVGAASAYIYARKNNKFNKV